MDLAASAAHAARPLVLVVEDDERLGPIVGRMLERSGYDHVLATTGDDALRAMEDHQRRLHVPAPTAPTSQL